MTRLAGNQMTLGGQALYGKAEYRLDGQGLLAGSSPGNVIGWLPAASAFYNYSVSDRLKFGIGAFGNFGLALDFGDEWAGRNLVTETAVMALTVLPTVAYRLDDPWSLGGGIAANYGIMQPKRVAVVGGGTREQDDRDWALAARLGVMYELSKTTRVGLVWNSEAELHFNIDATVTDLFGRTHTLPFGANMPMLQQLMGSAYHRVNDRWAIMGNLSWQDWSQFGNTTIETNAGVTTSSLQLKDTRHAAFGAQYALNAETRLNMGRCLRHELLQEPVADLVRPSQRRHLALGRRRPARGIAEGDLGFAVEYARSQSSSDPSPLISGRYDHTTMFFMSVNYSHRF